MYILYLASMTKQTQQLLDSNRHLTWTIYAFSSAAAVASPCASGKYNQIPTDQLSVFHCPGSSYSYCGTRSFSLTQNSISALRAYGAHKTEYQ